MGFFKIIKRLIGGLNLDNTTDDLPPTDFVSGYDVVDRNPSKSSEDKYLQPENNNELAYSLNNLGLTPKKYSVTITGLSTLATCEIRMRFSIGSALFWEIPFDYTAGDGGGVLFNEILTQFSLYPLIDDAQITDEDYDSDYLTFTFEIPSYYLYTDYYLSMLDDATTSATYDIKVIKDAISAEKAGELVPIEFTNVSSAQQVWATTKSSYPSQTTAAGNDVSNVFVLTFAQNNYLLDGEEVYIYGNGIATYVCVEATTDPNEYNVWGSTDPIGGGCFYATGSYTVVRNRRTASVIGYADKNYLNDTWNYTELLCSINLNFRTYNQIQAYGMVTNNGTIYNWTDYLNQIKRLYYFGNITTGGFLTYYNSEAIYDLDTIGQESNLQLGTNTSKVTLSVPYNVQSGRVQYLIGSKPEGCYVAFVRFKTNDGYYSTYTKASNVIWLRTDKFENHYSVTNSKKSISIYIEQIEQNLFEYFQVSFIHFTESSWTGYSLPEQKINGLSNLEIVDNGFDSASYIDFNDAGTLLEQIPFVFENAKSILPYALYEIAANVNLIEERDLADWAQTISLSITKREINIGDYTYSTKIEGVGSYWYSGINYIDKCSNEWTSYMPYDTYRFCVFIDWMDGSPTSTYWINDINFDASIVGNKACDKVGSDLIVYQYYLEAKNINLDYVLPNGEYLKDIIKDIRFGRALCNAQVYATGVGFAVMEDLSSIRYVSDGVGPYGSDILLDKKIAFYSPDFLNKSSSFDIDSGNDYVIANQAYIDVANNFIYTTGTQSYVGFFAVENAAIETTSTITNYVNADFGNNSNSIATLVYNETTSYNAILYNRGCLLLDLNTSLDYSSFGTFSQNIYLIKPYSPSGAYPISPQNTRFFIIPQDKWFDKKTHDSTTVYSIYGGDAFPTMSAYKTVETEVASANQVGYVAGFISLNRTNTSVRNGRYPYYSILDYMRINWLTDPQYGNDAYNYSDSFTPKYPFQNQVAFNPELKQITKLGSSIFYSEQAVSYDLAGGNRLWGAANRKDLEATYGDIIHMEILLGFSETGLLIVWQPERTTAQYFDNTANIKSNSGELLIGNGEIMGRKGADFTEYGCEHKWTIIKGQNPTGKDVVFWACFRKGAIMRLGADGTADLVGDINTLLTNRTFLALQNDYNNPDLPAHNYGCHAVWNNQTKEYILTLTLIPETVAKRLYAEGDWALSEDTWGFENLPVVYKSLIDDNDYPFTYTQYWERHEGYDDDAFQVWTLVWNELDNKFKTFRTFNPKIYGQFNNTYVSSHPNYPYQIFEHNKNKNEALFYCTQLKLETEAVTNPELYRIEGAGIESILPVPFAPNERTKWVVKIEGKNFEIVGGGTDYLEMANVDNDDILPAYTFPDGTFIYYICNCQDPYIEGVVNESKPRYVQFVLKNTQADDTLKRTEYYAGYDSLGTVTTQSFTNKPEEEFYNGESNVQIKMDTTNTPTNNEVGENAVEGKWMRFKQFWRWGKKNRVLTTSVAIEETEYKKQ